MSGTIIAEAIVYRKPVLVFSPERTIYKYVQDVFTIRSNEDCRNATKSIMYGFTPLYNNFTEICNKLLISFSDETSVLVVLVDCGSISVRVCLLQMLTTRQCD